MLYGAFAVLNAANAAALPAAMRSILVSAFTRFYLCSEQAELCTYRPHNKF